MTDWVPLPLGRFLRWCHLLWAFNFIRGHRAVDLYWYSSRYGRDNVSKLSCDCGRVFWDEEWFD